MNRFANLALNVVLAAAGTVGGIRSADQLWAPEARAYDDIYQVSDDPLLGVELRPRANRYINAHGFFGRDYTLAKPEGTWRIVGLGDSVAMYGSAERRNHYALLERYLPPLVGAPVEVLNLGVASYETPEQVRALETVGLSFAPDLVVLSYCVNDGISFADLARTLGAEPADDASDDHARLHAQVVDAMAAAGLDSAALHAGHIAPQAKWAQSVAAFRTLAELAHERDLPVVVVVFPALVDLDDYYLEATHEAVVALSHELGLAAIDLAPRYRDVAPGPDFRVNIDDALHPNALGYHVAAGALRTWFAAHQPWEARP